MTETAQIISELLKLDPPLQLKIVPEDEYVESNDGDKELLKKWSTTYPALVRGELSVVDPLLQTIVGRPLRLFEETLKETYAADGGVEAVKQYSRVK